MPGKHRSKVWLEKTISGPASAGQKKSKPMNLPKKDGRPGLLGAMGAYVAPSDIPMAEKAVLYQRTLPPAMQHDKYIMFTNAGVEQIGVSEARRRTVEWLQRKRRACKKDKQQEIERLIERASS